MIKGEDYIVMSLASIMTYFMEKNWTKSQLSLTIGVTPLQVYYYRTGKTLQPSPLICETIFNKLEIDGKNCLVDTYSTYEDLVSHVKVFKATNG